MINQNLLNELNRLGFGADIDALETYVATLQDAHGMGASLVTDTVYDQHRNLLKELKPDSYVLDRNWEVEDFDYADYDKILKEYGMRSITTIQNMQDLYKFKDALGDKSVNLIASTKLNGHAIRAVYKYGNLVAGSTRGRYKKGRDITRHLKAVLPNRVDAWTNYELVEVRGEMLVSYKNFESLKYILKTPLSAVTSLIRESVSDEELKLLTCVCYKCIISDSGVDYRTHFATLGEEMNHLKDCGFNIPLKIYVEDVDFYNLDATVEEIIAYFEDLSDNGELEYATDGIVVAINEIKEFYEFGVNGNAYLGNFALKMGRLWESNVYSSVIEEVQWVPGKTYLTPKAKITPVVTVTGAEVSTVPLYNVMVMERYGYTTGKTIYFKFGGETGVTACDQNGESVSAR